MWSQRTAARMRSGSSAASRPSIVTYRTAQYRTKGRSRLGDTGGGKCEQTLRKSCLPRSGLPLRAVSSARHCDAVEDGRRRDGRGRTARSRQTEDAIRSRTRRVMLSAKRSDETSRSTCTPWVREGADKIRGRQLCLSRTARRERTREGRQRASNASGRAW
eukprot:scaffold154623_cov28-Tisochrysis_lutea.AAC.1